ncbi:hypothetical protein LEMLEM_LOCUS1368 [Lemmus lemmus]
MSIMVELLKMCSGSKEEKKINEENKNWSSVAEADSIS